MAAGLPRYQVFQEFLAYGPTRSGAAQTVKALALRVLADQTRSFSMCELERLAFWLRNESEELAKNAISRREEAATMRVATVAELRASKVMAEKMHGHKISVSDSKKDASTYADIQDRIALKLESKASQLKAWADMVDNMVSFNAGRASPERREP